MNYLDTKSCIVSVCFKRLILLSISKPLGKRSKKNCWEGDIGPFSFPPLAWMGQEKWGHKKLFTDPLPPSCNRDKLSQVKYFITWYRKITLCKASKNAINCVETETPKRTWDMWQKDFDPSLHKNMSPFWWTKKRGFFLPPSLPYGPMSPSQQFFFFECFPKVYVDFAV